MVSPAFGLFAIPPAIVDGATVGCYDGWTLD